MANKLNGEKIKATDILKAVALFKIDFHGKYDVNSIHYNEAVVSCSSTIEFMLKIDETYNEEVQVNMTDKYITSMVNCGIETVEYFAIYVQTEYVHPYGFKSLLSKEKQEKYEQECLAIDGAYELAKINKNIAIFAKSIIVVKNNFRNDIIIIHTCNILLNLLQEGKYTNIKLYMDMLYLSNDILNKTIYDAIIKIYYKKGGEKVG